ncbi:hypothetical protein [Clostridium gasigenes]|uniref:hypothetical protein n=1 Tax=Clostridium gasigenes TaxID=94869 RepID=UPI001C0D0ED3|nr:hypothetical protein [Clostridium gasigenes]MBU3109557.1 hypothetical protein [Clostridium gasigenes]
MLKLEPIEFLFRALPESFLFILAIYSFSKTKINKNRYITSSIICGLAAFLIRMLPISYGVHTILDMGVAMLLGVIIDKVDVEKAIKSMLIVVIIEFIFEGVNILIIQNIFKADTNEVFSNPVLKTLYGIPSLIMLGIVIGGYYIIKWKKGELINV